MPLSEYARQKALRALLSGDCALGLMSGGGELTDANYRRQPARFAPGADGKWRNLDDVQYPALSADVTIDGWLLVDDDGLEVCRGETRPKVFEVGDQPFRQPGDVVVGLEG